MINSNKMKTTLRFACLFFISLIAMVGPASAQLLKKGMAVMTHFPGDPNNGGSNPNCYSLTVFDVRNFASGTPGQNWMAPRLHPTTSDSMQWKSNAMGFVFGVTIDDDANIYTTATSSYGGTQLFGSAGAGGIYKIDANTWSVSDFVTTDPNPSTTSTTKIPNTGCGLGNICYDHLFNQLFVTNFEDGKIYRIDMAGNILSKFDPFTLDGGSSSGFAKLGERLWGIGVYGNSTADARIYFSVWNEDGNNSNSAPPYYNEIWSVALDVNTGNFSGVEQLEIEMPDLVQGYFSNPVSDITFSVDGRMLLSERSMAGDDIPSAHDSRVFEYWQNGTQWTNSRVIYVGNYGANWNSAGGSDYGFLRCENGHTMSGCDSMIWSTGDALRFAGSNPDGGYDYVYGLAGVSYLGNSNVVANPDYVGRNSYYIDQNGDVNDIPKMGMGDVAVFRQCDYVPKCIMVNVITPNDDGINDVFYFDCITNDKWKLHFYDRWGSMVYSSDNYKNDWEPKSVSDGVYYYVLNGPLEGEKINGFIQVLH